MRVDHTAAVQARIADAMASVERLSLQTTSSEQRADEAEHRLAEMELQLENAAAAGDAAQEAERRAAELQEALDAASAQVEDLKVRGVQKLPNVSLELLQR